MKTTQKVAITALTIVGLAAISAGCLTMSMFAEKRWGMATQALAVAGTAALIALISLVILTAMLRHFDRRSR